MARTKQTARKRKNNQDTKHADENNQSSDAKQPKVDQNKKPKPEFKMIFSTGEPVTESYLSPNAKGFLISFAPVQNGGQYCKIVEDAIQLLNEYADSLYRTEGKTCYFEHKLANPPPISPVFIETDMDNPSLLVDAILADVQKASFDDKKVDAWNYFTPVNVTCHASREEIVSKAKAVLQPLFENPEMTKVPAASMINCGRKVQGRKVKGLKGLKDVQNDLEKYVESKVQDIKKPEDGAVPESLDMQLGVRKFKETCCISLLDNFSTKANCVGEILKKKNCEENVPKV